MTNAEPGWKVDSQGQLRYWTGSIWVDDPAIGAEAPGPTIEFAEQATMTAPVAAAAPVAPGYAQPAAPQNQWGQPQAWQMQQPGFAPPSQTNGLGVAGFVLALLALLLFWVPFLGWILWLVGLILSAVGMARQPRGLAIAGLVVSLIGIVLLVLTATAVTGFILSF